MFTGIVESIGIVKAVEKNRIAIQASVLVDSMIGDSISVNGVCLTISKIDDKEAAFDISSETIKKTSLGSLKAGQKLNIERALKAQDRLGGHFVSGHVDGIGRIIKIAQSKEDTVFEIEIPDDLSKYLIPKGSIAVDGISLTISECRGSAFSVSIIPHTLKVTNLSQKKRGDTVNIEIDMIGKYIEKLLSPNKAQSKINYSFLLQHGLL